MMPGSRDKAMDLLSASLYVGLAIFRYGDRDERKAGMTRHKELMVR
jgi:hypothetical protein